ncbi:unnamed protein product [Urochloa humidicola]
MLIILALLLLSHSASRISSSTIHDNNTDVLSLLAFKAANDPTGVLKSWNSSTNHCLWKGVNCSLTHPGRVTVLQLPGNTLAGPISSSLGNLTFLMTLDLSANGFSGSIPHGLARWRNILQLLLGGNNLSGRIPASLGNASALEWIDLSSNSFIGQIPSSLGKLSKLSLLDLEVNKLGAGDTQGLKFIDALTNCTLLRTLSLRQNQLHGVIPNSLGNLSISLQYLLLGSNNLSGVVPPSIGNLSGLMKLGLGNNNFSGTIEWIAQLYKLQLLLLQANNFNGPIPSSVSNLTLLSVLYLGNNKLEATIPPSLGNLHKLTSLDLSCNNLQGSIPPEIGNLNQLFNLSVSSNQLTGEIPSTFGQFQSITTIRMDQNFLTGDIPVVFSSLQSLNILNLSHNYLSGTIPSNLSNLRLLTSIDLSYNHLYGKVPRDGAFENSTIVSLNDNWGLCGGPIDLHMPVCPDDSQRIKRRNYLIKALIPVFGFMSLGLLVYFLFLAKKASRQLHLSMPYFGDKFLKVSYNDLAEATKSFSEANLVGRGSYGSVYRGKLKEHKVQVAVKVFNLEMQGAERSFMSECEALRSIQHRNLLRIITACSTVDNKGHVFKALVYEFMPNGNLDTWLHQKEDGKAPKRLSFTQRVSISVNIADALDYLHHDCGRPTIHCDLKPSNILLNDDMVALLGDFGIASFYMDSLSTSTRPVSSSSVGMKGTIGYIAPEYAGGRHASTSGDVYSFGVVLLEMMTGKRPTDPLFKDGVDIVSFVESNFPHNILHVLDAHIIEECKDIVQRKIPDTVTNRSLVSLLQVALHCTRQLPSKRMNMKQVAGQMHEIKESYVGWKTKNYGSHDLV